MQNRRVTLVSRPVGVAQAENFVLDAVPAEAPADGEILVRNHFLSVDPAMRGWIADKANYSIPVPIGSVMRALCVGVVIESRTPEFAAGDLVTGWFGWQEYAAVAPSAVVRKIAETDLPLSASLGVLGINGVTAYLALDTIGQPRSGETVVVSTAAGAVGSAAGQIARIRGCRTIGITSSETKQRLCIDQFGYDAAIDYKREDVGARLAELCPEGIDVYYDNTAGAISDAVMHHLALRARIIVCGTAAFQSWSEWPLGPRVERHLLVRRARMEGFVIFDHMDRYEEAVAQLARWVREGHLTYVEDILDGIEACPDALAGLYRGENLGKRLIRLV